MAAALRRFYGCTLAFPEGKEDIRVQLPGMLPFIVECKRPSHEGSLQKNIARVRDQLATRRVHPEFSYGIAVFGVDRTSGRIGGESVEGTDAALDAGLARCHDEQIRLIKRRERGLKRPLAPHATLIGVHLLGSAVVGGASTSISSLRLYNSGNGVPGQDKSLPIHEAFGARRIGGHQALEDAVVVLRRRFEPDGSSGR